MTVSIIFVMKCIEDFEVLQFFPKVPNTVTIIYFWQSAHVPVKHFFNIDLIYKLLKANGLGFLS